MKTVLIILGIAILAVVIYFGYRSYYPKSSDTSAPAIETTSVEIKGMAFSPANISVTAGKTVTFTNNDSINHTVTADDGSFDSGPLAPGSTYTRTFDTAGTISYHCKIHPSMTGKVEVK